jgi:hypothetical protein
MCCLLHSLGPSPPRTVKPAASKAPAARRKPGQQAAAGGRRPKASSAKRSSSSGGAAGSDGGRARLAGVLYGGRWRVDGGVRQQQDASPTQCAQGYLVGEQTRWAATAPWHRALHNHYIMLTTY